jgi:hypothetical protein
MVKISIKYAITCGIFLLILFFLTRYFGVDPFIDLGQLLFDLLIFFIFIYFAQNEFKKYHHGGILHFWQGMTIGFMVYLPGVLFFCGGLWIAMLIDPEILTSYQQAAMKLLEDQSKMYIEQFGEDQYLEQQKAIENTTISSMIFTALIKKILVGLFITPVVSIILRKIPK